MTTMQYYGGIYLVDSFSVSREMSATSPEVFTTLTVTFNNMSAKEQVAIMEVYNSVSGRYPVILVTDNHINTFEDCVFKEITSEQSNTTTVKLNFDYNTHIFEELETFEAI